MILVLSTSEENMRTILPTSYANTMTSQPIGKAPNSPECILPGTIPNKNAVLQWKDTSSTSSSNTVTPCPKSPNILHTSTSPFRTAPSNNSPKMPTRANLSTKLASNESKASLAPSYSVDVQSTTKSLLPSATSAANRQRQLKTPRTPSPTSLITSPHIPTTASPIEPATWSSQAIPMLHTSTSPNPAAEVALTFSAPRTTPSQNSTVLSSRSPRSSNSSCHLPRRPNLPPFS